MMAWFANLRLSLSQWLIITLGVLCGVLVTALKLQGSRLHKAQIEALSAKIDLTNGREEDKIKALQDKFDREVYSYENSKDH